MKKTGLLVVVSAPSGGGKTTVIEKVLEAGDSDFQYSISATTRPRRLNEKDGRDYLFLDAGEFWKRQGNNEFVEWAEVHGYYYATRRKPLDEALEEGKLVILDMDVDGGLEIKKQYQEVAVLIFIKPPSFESLLQRLKERKTETQAEIDKRLSRYPKEMNKSKYYDYQIVNEDLERTVKEILSIISHHYKGVNWRYV